MVLLHISLAPYTKEIIRKYQADFGAVRKCNIPMDPKCHPELDNTPLLQEAGNQILSTNHWSRLLCQWLIVSGRFDLCYAITSLSRFSAGPREGHLEVAQEIMGYLRNYPRSTTNERIMSNPQLTANWAGRNRGQGAGRGNNQRSQFWGIHKTLGVFETADEWTKSGQSQNQFVNTLKTLSRYAAENIGFREGKVEIRDLLCDLTPFSPKVPTKPEKTTATEAVPAAYDPIDIHEYTKAAKEYKTLTGGFRLVGQATMCYVIWGQSSSKMQSNIARSH